MLRVFLLAVLVLSYLPVRAEIYQWRDASGRLHYGDRKPARGDAAEVSERLSEINTDESGAERKKLQRLFQTETAAEKAHRQRDEAAQRESQFQRRRQCDNARKHLAVLQGPVYFTREDGSTYSISEAEREQRAAEMAAKIERYCGL